MEGKDVRVLTCGLVGIVGECKARGGDACWEKGRRGR